MTGLKMTSGSVVLALAALLLIGCTPASPPDPTETEEGVATMEMRSTAFDDGGMLPQRFAHPDVGGENISPPLSWSGAPDGTTGFLVTVIDLHPVADRFVHWAIEDIPPEITSLEEGASGDLPGGRELENSYGQTGWGGPRPPEGTGQHTYQFTVYALVEPARLPDQPSSEDIARVTQAKVLAAGTMQATYGR